MIDTTPVKVEAVFDEHNFNWNPQTEYNLLFLRMNQNYANDLLRKQGHLFLNEVFDLLGIRRTPEGAIGGWLWDVNGPTHVDFGVFGPELDLSRVDKSIPLSFNIIPSMYTHI